MKYLLYISVLVLFLTGCQRNHPEAKYVWADSEGNGRAHYVMFRNEFVLSGKAGAHLNIFVDSRYHLFVNGEMVNFGPVRFYPENPQFDTFDISSFLSIGKNVIAVKALSNGTNTYQIPLSQAGFIAWGEVKQGNKIVHSFETPGNWKCMEMKGYDRNAPKMSFATGPMEIYDSRMDPAGWAQVDFNDDEWPAAKLITKQEHWGEPKARTIPYLTQDVRPAAKLLGAYSLKSNEEIYSFRVKSEDRSRADFGKNKYAFAYTYIYSPNKQSVRAGLFWGEFWLNGEGPLPGLGLEEGRPVRSDVILNLDAGWNYFFIKYGIVWGSWEFYMAIPKTAELILSPFKELNSDTRFMTAGPFSEKEEELVRELKLPLDKPDDLPVLSATWSEKKENDGAGNPAWEVAWSYFDQSIQVKEEGNSINLPQAQPIALVYDMGEKTLGRFYLDIEAPEGCRIDIAFAEDLQNRRPWILKRPGLYTAVSFTTREGENHFESFKPYGARYLQANISGHDQPAELKDIGMISQTYPFEKYGYFECSDTMLNAIWELGWRTLLVCSEDAYTDTPFRERGLYAGDALPEYGITLSGSGDSRLMKQCIFLFSQMYNDLMLPGGEQLHPSVNHMADYPLLTLLAYAWTINRSGDLAFADTYYEGYKNLMKHTASWRIENGLLDHPRAFIEWTRIDKDAILTAVQSLAAYCFQTMARISDMLGKSDTEWFLKEEKLTLEAIHRLCWDPAKGAFRDGYKDGKAIEHHYPISSIWPTLFGQTSEDQEKSLEVFYASTLEDIGSEDRKRLATPYGGFYIIDALYRKGYTSVAESFMKKYWSPMILKHNDTAWENFGDGSDGQGQGTLSHAWSGGPTYNMTRHILGVDLGFPEFSSPDSLVFRPQAEGLEWARGAVPHPRGLIEVSWQIKGDKLDFSCNVPDGISWSVEPKGRLAGKELWINNKKLINN